MSTIGDNIDPFGLYRENETRKVEWHFWVPVEFKPSNHFTSVLQGAMCNGSMVSNLTRDPAVVECPKCIRDLALNKTVAMQTAVEYYNESRYWYRRNQDEPSSFHLNMEKCYSRFADMLRMIFENQVIYEYTPTKHTCLLYTSPSPRDS